jgi:hypothetical protein
MHHQWSRYAKQFRDDPQDSSEALIKNSPWKPRPLDRGRQASPLATGRDPPLLGLSILKAVFAIDGRSINVGEQPALSLGQVQVDGSGLASGDQKLPDFVHVCERLMSQWKLLKRD